VGVRDDRLGLARPLDEDFFAGVRLAAGFLDEDFFAGAAFATAAALTGDAALTGAAGFAGAAFFDDAFFAGARLDAARAAGAASSAFAVGLRSRFGRSPAALLPVNKDATISSTCTTIPSARIPTVTPATSASGESIFVSAFFAATLAASLISFKLRVATRPGTSTRVRQSTDSRRVRLARRVHPFPAPSFASRPPRVRVVASAARLASARAENKPLSARI